MNFRQVDIMKVNVTDKDVIVFAIKRVDTNNSYEFERELLQTIEKNQDKRLILDCSEIIIFPVQD